MARNLALRAGARRLATSVGAVGAVGAVALLSACSEQQFLELTFAHAGPPESLIAISAEEFARVANERLEGRATVVVYGSSQLGDDRDVLLKLKLGTVDIALPSTVLSSAVPAFALFEMPYLVRDRDHMRRIEEALVWTELAPRAEDAGYELLSVWENGFRHVTNRVRPIRTPTDLAGIKIRTPNSPWRVSLFRALDANPSPMPFAEVFMALQTGVMDGQENPLSNVVNASLHEVQTYLSLTGHVYSPAYLITGSERWARLPAGIRQTLEEVARETQAFVVERARAIDADALEQLRAAGMQVNEVDRDAFVRASSSVYNEFDAQVPGGAAWIQRALALAASDEVNR